MSYPEIHPNQQAFADGYNCKGLTKLQYTVIHIMSGLPSHLRSDDAARIAISRANALFTEMNKVKPN